jgi:hypothetical protein
MKQKKIKSTYTIREDIVNRLTEHCDKKMSSKSTFVDFAIEEKLNRELYPMLPENRIPDDMISGIIHK